MLGDLTKKEIIDLLESQVFGRLGCSLDGETYVVPINFIYQNNAIYAHAGAGKKIEMMRANPRVCFQVDEILDTFNWKSAILFGDFVELKNEERQQVMQGIIQKIMPLTNRSTEQPSHAIEPEKHSNLIVFKIDIIKVTGRFEAHEAE